MTVPRPSARLRMIRRAVAVSDSGPKIDDVKSNQRPSGDSIGSASELLSSFVSRCRCRPAPAATRFGRRGGAAGGALGLAEGAPAPGIAQLDHEPPPGGTHAAATRTVKR